MRKKINTYPIKKQRNEFGKLIRKAYESHTISGIRRKDIKEYVPMGDGLSRTITTFPLDNMMLEVYE